MPVYWHLKMKIINLWNAMEEVLPDKNVAQYTVCCRCFRPALCVILPFYNQGFFHILIPTLPSALRSSHQSLPTERGYSIVTAESIKFVSCDDRSDLLPCLCPIQMPVHWTRTSKTLKWSWHLQDRFSLCSFFRTLHSVLCLERITLCFNCRV